MRPFGHMELFMTSRSITEVKHAWLGYNRMGAIALDRANLSILMLPSPSKQ